MKAQLLREPAPIETRPLQLSEVAQPVPAAGEVLLKVQACGVCHTDLHLVEGDLPEPRLPVIPGHQVVGTIVETGLGADRFQVGARVGVYWLHAACGDCDYCLRGEENLCEQAQFTGYTTDGGYAEYITVRQDYVAPIPDSFTDIEVAPLLCAGVIGYRSLRLSELQPGERLGLYGFGASAHIGIQVARHWGCEVTVFTRSADHQQHARELGAVWVGEAQQSPPHKLDRAIIFAPAGWIVPLALGHLRRGGTLAINAIHMSNTPEMPYHLLWHERTVRSVANVTRRDAEEFLPLAAEIAIRADTHIMPLEEANEALLLLKQSAVKGALVLEI